MVTWSLLLSLSCLVRPGIFNSAAIFSTRSAHKKHSKLGQRNWAIVTLIMHDSLQLGGPSIKCFRAVDSSSIPTGVSGACSLTTLCKLGKTSWSLYLYFNGSEYIVAFSLPNRCKQIEPKSHSWMFSNETHDHAIWLHWKPGQVASTIGPIFACPHVWLENTTKPWALTKP